jgi:hypothetical protein
MSRSTTRAIAKIRGAGRNGDTELAHMSPDEIAILNAWQGGESINPETGLPEYFSLKKVLKSVAKAAGALAGAALGGPVGAALGGGLTAKLMGDSNSKALLTGALSGLGAYGVQQSGIGDSMGIDALSSGANLLGNSAGAAAAGESAGGFTAAIPLLALGAAAASGSGKTPKPAKIKQPQDMKPAEYEPLDREQKSLASDPYSYGQFAPEAMFFDQVNPEFEPVAMRRGGRVHFKYGGDVSEGGKKEGGKDSGGQGPKGGGEAKTGGHRDRTTSAGRTAGAAGPTARDTAMKGSSSGGGGSATIADKMIMDRYLKTPAEKVKTEKDYWSAVSNLGKSYTDFKDYNNTPIQNLGNALAGMFGVSEIDPLSQPLGARVENEDASWGIDPIGAALGLGGALGLTPFGLGAVYSGIKYGTGWQGPMISFDEYDPISTEESASPYGSYDFSPMGQMFDGMGGGTGQSAPAVGGGTGKDRPLPITSSVPTMGQPQQLPPGAQPVEEEEEDPAGRTYIPLANVYTYGQTSPEHAFFTGQLPMVEMNMRRGGNVRGPGDGQSDDIPAMLSNGEYVIDAETVSAIGDGSTDAGAKKLDQMRHKIRARKRKAPAHKIPAKTGGLSQYLKVA